MSEIRIIRQFRQGDFGVWMLMGAGQKHRVRKTKLFSSVETIDTLQEGRAERGIHSA